MRIANVSNIFGLFILVPLMIGCSGMDIKKIEFVKNGVPQHLILSKGCEQKEGYLQLNEEFLIKADQVIYGDEIEVTMRLSISESEGHILITVADNTIGITNEYIDGAGKLVFLQGPSVGQTVNLGDFSQYISSDKPFDLTICYRNNFLTYKIDGKEIFTQKSVVKPAGMIKMAEYAEDFHIYDFTASGQFKPIEEFYSREFLLNRGQNSVDQAAKRVKDDPNRPAYHFQPPANWNNDPNGMFFYDGYYHMFYQHNPYSDEWNWMHWGHARSKDLVHWEHLPIALWPSVEKGENHCFSGSGYVMDDGKPVLFYTSIGHKNPQHWAAVPEDNALINWQKHSQNPILVMEDHGEQFIDDWRDPYLFRENGETYMVIGGHPRGEKGSIMLYEALNPELTEWRFLGVPFSGEEGNWECPNFFKIDEKYVLVYSPHGHVEYYIGSLDLKNVKFIPETHGVIDNGANWNYYAPNTLQKDDGRRILFGWIPGFKKEQGWQGAISLPRDLSINDLGRLIQKPVPELTNLRGDLLQKTDVTLNNKPFEIEIAKPQFEMLFELKGEGTDNIGFKFNEESGNPYLIILTSGKFIIGEDNISVDPNLGEKIKTIQLFFDRTVIEIFVNDGLACATKVIYPDKDNLNFEIFSTDKNVVIKDLKLWEMNSIW